MATIRFGVGNPQSVRSSTWSLSAGQAEVYLIRRFKNEIIKFSFHSSGKWRFAQISREPRPALFEWDRPKPVLNSWILGPTIMFSPFLINKSIQPPENYAKKINWLKLTDDKNIRIAMVAFSKGESTPNHFLIKRGLFVDWYDYLPIIDDGRSGSDKVWVFSWIEPLQEFRKKQILDISNLTKIHYKRKGNPKSIKASFYPIIPPNEEERQRGLSPTFIDIIPEQKNLRRDS